MEMKHIPLDIIERILLKLPVKSIIRFQLASKFWYAITSDASFVETHLNYVNTNQSLDLVEFRSRNKVSIYEKGLFKCGLWTPIPIKYPEIHLVGSYNGLVCMHDNVKIFVFNPATRECISIPNPSIGKSHGGLSMLEKLNFGFNPNANEYMIMHFSKSDRIEYTMHVFTLGKDINSWRQIDRRVPLVFLSNPAINIGATMYWKVKYSSSGHSIISILFFDLSEEKLGHIETPEEENYESVIMDMNGRLCWVSFKPSGGNVMLKLWSLDKENEKNKSNWTLLYAINLSPLMTDGWSPSYIRYVRSSAKKNRIILLSNSCRCYCDFTMKNDSVECLISERGSLSGVPSITSFTYVESLLPLPQVSVNFSVKCVKFENIRNGAKYF